MIRLMPLSKKDILERIWRAEPAIKNILMESKHVEEARFIIFDYLDRLRRDLYNMKSNT